MCNECKRIYCSDSCPNSRGDSERCCVCGDAVLFDEEHFRGHGVTVCSNCADTLDADDLIELCSLEDTAELFAVLGFEHRLGD